MNDKSEWMKLLGFVEESLRAYNKTFCSDDVPAGVIGNLRR